MVFSHVRHYRSYRFVLIENPDPFVSLVYLNLTHLCNVSWFTERAQKSAFPIIYVQSFALGFPSKQHRRSRILLMECSRTWTRWDGSIEQTRQSIVVVKLFLQKHVYPESQEGAPIRSVPPKALLRTFVSWCCRSSSWSSSDKVKDGATQLGFLQCCRCSYLLS